VFDCSCPCLNCNIGSKSILLLGIGDEIGEAVGALLIQNSISTVGMLYTYTYYTYNELKNGTGCFSKYSEKLLAIFGNVGNILLCVTFEINYYYAQKRSVSNKLRFYELLPTYIIQTSPKRRWLLTNRTCYSLLKRLHTSCNRLCHGRSL
jgi:hypothetical protein